MSSERITYRLAETAGTHQPDLLPETTAPAERRRRIISGRVRFFPRKNTNEQTESSNDPAPFDDPIELLQ